MRGSIKIYTAIITASLLQLATFSHAVEAASGIKSTTILKTQHTWNGQKIEYPAGVAEVTGVLVEIAPQAETGWHQHPFPSFGVIIAGELDVTLENGQVKHLKTGDAIAEVFNTLHNGKNVGTTPVKLIVFYTGTSNQALTIKP